MKTVQIPNDLHRRLKIISAERNIKLIDLIKEGIDYVLHRHEEPNFTYVTDKKVVKEYYGENQ
jgi:hypothetical protein